MRAVVPGYFSRIAYFILKKEEGRGKKERS
jgi:hypothetical protein